MTRTEMGGDHITKHGTHISRDMEPGGGPYISNDMGHVTREMGPGGGGGGGNHFTTSYINQSYLVNIVTLYS